MQFFPQRKKPAGISTWVPSLAPDWWAIFFLGKLDLSASYFKWVFVDILCISNRRLTNSHGHKEDPPLGGFIWSQTCYKQPGGNLILENKWLIQRPALYFSSCYCLPPLFSPCTKQVNIVFHCGPIYNWNKLASNLFCLCCSNSCQIEQHFVNHLLFNMWVLELFITIPYKRHKGCLVIHRQ